MDAGKHKEVTLLEILDRVLVKGVVIAGDLTISVADVDLIYASLRVLISSVDTLERQRLKRVAVLEPGEVKF